MKLVELTQGIVGGSKSVWVKPSEITHIKAPLNDHHATTIYINGESISVLERPEEVMKKCHMEVLK